MLLETYPERKAVSCSGVAIGSKTLDERIASP